MVLKSPSVTGRETSLRETWAPMVRWGPVFRLTPPRTWLRSPPQKTARGSVDKAGEGPAVVRLGAEFVGSEPVVPPVRARARLMKAGPCRRSNRLSRLNSTDSPDSNSSPAVGAGLARLQLAVCTQNALSAQPEPGPPGPVAPLEARGEGAPGVPLVLIAAANEAERRVEGLSHVRAAHPEGVAVVLQFQLGPGGTGVFWCVFRSPNPRPAPPRPERPNCSRSASQSRRLRLDCSIRPESSRLVAIAPTVMRSRRFA